ncbi:uncharacterized protein V6R79_008648 [Siganus canaliculatus]
MMPSLTCSAALKQKASTADRDQAEPWMYDETRRDEMRRGEEATEQVREALTHQHLSQTSSQPDLPLSLDLLPAAAATSSLGLKQASTHTSVEADVCVPFLLCLSGITQMCERARREGRRKHSIYLSRS